MSDRPWTRPTWTQAKSRPTKPAKLPKHEPWMNRWALWAFRGAGHLATHAAPVGKGVVATLACGGSATFGIRADTWWCLKVVKRERICRRCTAILRAAGESGPIGRDER